MRRLVFALLILLPAPAVAQADPKLHKLCAQAKDYAGCIKVMTTPAPVQEDALTPLRNAMKQVAARLRAGTSLRDSTETFRPVIDQMAIAQAIHPDAEAVQKAKLASRMFDALQLAWDTRIKAAGYSLNQFGIPVYNCEALKLTVDNYNSIPGAPYVSWRYTKGAFGWKACKVPNGELPEVYISSNVVRILDEGAISPVEIAAREKEYQEREAKAKRERDLCILGPWNRYLEENPSIKQWAAVNPKAAETAKTKFLADPKNQGGCQLRKMYGLDMNHDLFAR